MSESIQKIDKMIELDKEMLGILPKNNLKNITKTLEKIKETRQKYVDLKEKLIFEINFRYEKIDQIVQNPEIEKIGQNISKISNLSLMNEMTTSYEKLGLDKLIYRINGFYKKKLEVINEDINNCIKKFKEVGIILTEKDFDYSEYVNEYMKVFLEESKNGNIYSEKIKSTFEKLYTQCSELITHISLNFRYLYHKNEKNIDKAIMEQKENILKELNISKTEILNEYTSMKERMLKLKEIDTKIILNQFLDKELLVTDFKQENIDSLVEKIKTSQINNEEEFIENIKKLSKNLYEYRVYSEYKFLVDDIVTIRKKEKNTSEDKKGKNKKDSYALRMDEIEAAEKKLFNLNNQIKKKENPGIFGKKQNKGIEDIILKRNNQILELKDLYRKLDDDMIKRGIANKITDSSSILDVLMFSTSYYNFIARAIIKKYPEIVEADINAKIDKLKQFVELPYLSVINNTSITERKDIRIIIKDKFKLLGLNISKDDFEEANLEALENLTKILSINYNITKSKVTVQDIAFMCKVKELLKK